MTSSKFHQPWINTRIKRLSRRKRKWYRRYRQTRSHTAKQVYVSLKKESRQACKTALNDYLNNIFSEDKGNKQFWSYIKSRRKETVGIASLCNENGITVTSSQEKANILNRQLTSVFNPRNSKPIPNLPWQHPKMKPLDFSAAGIEKLLKGLDTTKSCGPDDLSARLLQCLSSEHSSFCFIPPSSIDNCRETGDTPVSHQSSKKETKATLRTTGLSH